MPATTIRLEAELLKTISTLKAKDQSISDYVRELIEREYRARHRPAAEAYERFLQANPEERAMMEVWESASLATRKATR
jgi:hypothetical protein